jgi:3-methyladenine DNA glycosylase AlkD
VKSSFVDNIANTFANVADQHRADAMSAYMKNKFVFFGIPSPKRKEIVLFELKNLKLKNSDELHVLLLDLWEKPEREYQYTAMLLAERYKKLWNKDSILVFEEMLINASWWDTVDTISSHCIGPFFQKYPELKKVYLYQWENSSNMWLKRVCIIHQLTYKHGTDTDYLEKIIFMNQESKEFFIQKAIGWALRQYAKVNPIWVNNFVASNTLKPLSSREALKNIKL